MVQTLDVSIPAQLTLALVPDLILMGGAMVLLIVAAWRRESDDHQRNVGLASIVLCGITMIAVLNWATRYTATPGPISIDASILFVFFDTARRIQDPNQPALPPTVPRGLGDYDTFAIVVGFTAGLKF